MSDMEEMNVPIFTVTVGPKINYRRQLDATHLAGGWRDMVKERVRSVRAWAENEGRDRRTAVKVCTLIYVAELLRVAERPFHEVAREVAEHIFGDSEPTRG